MRRTFCSSLFAAAAMIVPLSGADAQTTRTINFNEKPGAVTIQGDGVEVTLQPKIDAESILNLAISVRVPGYQTIIVNDDGRPVWADRWVAIGKLSGDDPAPSVLLEGFTGGAHCCATLTAIVPNAGRLKVVEFEPVDGDSDKVFPKDIDGDGTVDFERQDDSFRYQFASGAGSYSPPIFLNIYKGQIVDVSGQPGFRPRWLAFAKATRTRCMDKTDIDRNGACAAYAAAAARLGQFDTAMTEVTKFASPSKDFLPEGCSVSVKDGECPEAKKIKFYSFDSALRWFLRDRGYID